MKTPSHRIQSLDVFRGITVAAMILVNNPGDWGTIYAPLKHAEWHGCTPTDLIFPFFIYIVGVSIVFALNKKRQAGFDDRKLIPLFLKRATILYLLGLIMALFPDFDFETVRLAGVLQRIAVVYLATSMIYIKTSFKTQFVILLFLLVGYWLIMTLVSVPGVGPANLEKGTNLAAYIDRLILTEKHIWKPARTWDPEGILSTLPAIGSCLTGVLTGSYLVNNAKPVSSKIRMLFYAGAGLVLAGVVWNEVFPFNKSLWTSSFVFFTSGLATLLFSILYFIIDIKHYQKWAFPFLVYGLNAITVFFLSGMLAKTMNVIKIKQGGEELSLKTFLFQTYFTPHLSAYNASLGWALFFVVFWLVLLILMYRKKIFIKV